MGGQKLSEIGETEINVKILHRVLEKNVYSTKILQNSYDSDERWCTVSWINLLQSTANVFHLTWVMSPHYFVKLSLFC